MIGIIGAGISGLTLAYHLQKKNIPYVIFEEKEKSGGYIKTESTNDYVLDVGPNSILADDEILSFFREVNIENELVEANPSNKARYIFKGGKYQVLPDSPPALLKSNFFSFKTKLAILSEFFRKKQTIEDETLGHFITRRFNKEVTDYVLNPFVTGIYAGNPEDLLVKLTFPVLSEMENKYGSVLKGMIKSGGGGRRKSYNFKNGMATLSSGIASKLNSLKLNARVEKVSYNDGNYNLEVNENGQIQNYKVKYLVVSTPTFQAATLLKNVSADLSGALEDVYYPPMALVHTVYNKDQVHFNLGGFGGLNPKIENKFVAGSIWTSSVFSGRIADDKVLFTSFVGGSQYEEQFKETDEAIKNKVASDFNKDLNIEGKPVMQRIYRWNQAIPQYNKHLKYAYSIAEKLEKKGLFFCAGWYKGVSLSDCIKNGKRLAENISTFNDIHS